MRKGEVHNRVTVCAWVSNSGTTLIQKNNMTIHLMKCKNKCDVIQLTSVPPSHPCSHQRASQVNVERSFLHPPSKSTGKFDQCYIQSASMKTSEVATDLQKHQEAPTEPDLSLSPTGTTSENPIARIQFLQLLAVLIFSPISVASWIPLKRKGFW